MAAGPPELPPRTRRIPCHSPQPPPVVGTTSAYAENTMIRFSMLTDLGNYLRVRGEYSMTVTDQFAQAELPPRTRRILGVLDARFKSRGTTSAYAENTHGRQTVSCTPRNYLRVRGEYLLGGYHQLERCELPPRTRRIHPQRYRLLGGGGTTSAYAENTPERGHDFIPRRNYLRVRGEYLLPFCLGIIRMELPPRTRRILRSKLLARLSYGTTSAYAENTCLILIGCHPLRNYLRVRGEYSDRPLKTLPVSELPPRTRRIPPLPPTVEFLHGTTSAYAENTTVPHHRLGIAGNYLRVRGEYFLPC